MSFASMGAFAGAGDVVSGLVSAVVEGAKLGAEAAVAAFTVIKAGVHGAVGGALSVAQGGNFLEGLRARPYRRSAVFWSAAPITAMVSSALRVMATSKG